MLFVDTVMPSVRGMLLDEAQTVLKDVAAKVSVEPAFVSDVPPRLRVIAQKPEPGTELEPSVEITLIVSPEHAL
jgi:beta-lactam-binding protein with PASTA domain